ncbi:hypothetical protein [Salinarimonas soli]|uniref:Uncharacterized protein n=1 Tax=Salinarimonas soli TaxID=1638099 RepID=A0A5B2V9Z6_9HYPH|nr:hypothetical protein [Salinarimonas soli]KAA2235548.1 hypothetical protein F0L46_18770 [Salinarimonas soli]
MSNPVRCAGFAALGAILFAASSSRAADGFEKVRCDRAVVPALVGARVSNSGPVAAIEARRKAIGLEHKGAEIVADGVDTIYWRICGRDFVVLHVRDVARDAIELPPHSRAAPAFSTTVCEVAGRKLEGVFLGVFASAPGGDAPMSPVRAAWRIDHARGFVPLTSGAACATDGIDPADASR